MSDNQKKLNEQLVKVVLDDGLTDEIRLKKVKYLVRLGANVNQKINGKSLLKIAREKGYKEIEEAIKESLRKSFDELLEGDKFERVLDECEYANGHKVVVSKQKAINLGKQFWGNDGKLKSAKEIEVLIQQGADVNVQVNNGWTALIWAAEKGHKEIVEMLLEGGADVNIKSDDGYTALIWASREGHKEVVEMLLQNGADVNQKDGNSYTALIWASRGGYKEVVEVLLERGADVNHKDKYSKTALMRASNNGYNEIVQLLLEGGADVHQKDKYGETALMGATDKETKMVIKEYIKKTSGEPTNGGFFGKIFDGLTM